MDVASETSEQWTKSDDTFSEINITSIQLEMNKTINHLETLVRQLKRDSNFLKSKCAPYETGQRIKIIKIRIAK